MAQFFQIGLTLGNSNMWQVEKPSRGARTVAQLPVSINEEPGYTRDISATGMFIVQGRQQEIGSRIAFTVDLDTPIGTIKLSCEGEVVRMEEAYDSDGAVGIGIRIIKQFGRQLMFEDDGAAIASR